MTQKVILSGGKKTQQCEVRGGGWGRDIPGEPPRQVRWAGPRGCGGARAAPRAWAWLCPPRGGAPTRSGPESLSERREAQPRLQLGRVGHAHMCNCACTSVPQRVPARAVCAGASKEELLRDQTAISRPLPLRRPAAACGTRAFAEPSPSLPTELAVP